MNANAGANYVYVTGLEHSGTTLTDHMLSSHPNVVGLGEVASFFSVEHMTDYLQRWSTYADHDLCSCGERWSVCEFWAPLLRSFGESSKSGFKAKYSQLFLHALSLYGAEVTLVDSSKRLDIFQENFIESNFSSEQGLTHRVSIVFAIKNPREFASSMIKKSGNKPSLLNVIRYFNYWYGANREILEQLSRFDVPVFVSIYRSLCENPEKRYRQLMQFADLPVNGAPEVSHSNSHIAMGNKDFVIRNRSNIKYDSSWQRFCLIKVVHFFHWRARRLYFQLESKANLN